MGSNSSKKATSPSDAYGGSSSSSNNEDSNIRIQFVGELGSYETECQQDPAVRNFDSILQQRTIGAISILASSQMNSLSFDTLRQVTGCLLENNQQAVKFILACRRNEWKNKELFDLVEDYFENTLQTLDLCTALEKCLKKARDSQLIIQFALKCFEDEEDEEEEVKYRKTLGELRKFKELGDPFTEEFFRLFQLVYQKQISMLEKLQLRKRKLDKKLKSLKAWRRVSNIIFISAFATVLICSVVAATMAAPPVAAALAAAASIPLGSVGKWVDTLWKRYSNVVKDEKDVIRTMEVGTFVAMSDLGGIRVLVDRLEIHIGSLLQNVDFAGRDEEAVKFWIEEIKKKLGVFMQSIENLGKEVDRCSGDVQRARTVVLQKVIRDPN